MPAVRGTGDRGYLVMTARHQFDSVERRRSDRVPRSCVQWPNSTLFGTDSLWFSGVFSIAQALVASGTSAPAAESSSLAMNFAAIDCIQSP